MKTIRASEVGAYLYCHRAWWYQKLGYASQNQADLFQGQAIHERHGRRVLEAGCLKVLAYTLMLLALFLFSMYISMRLLQ